MRLLLRDAVKAALSHPNAPQMLAEVRIGRDTFDEHDMPCPFPECQNIVKLRFDGIVKHLERQHGIVLNKILTWLETLL